MAFYDPARDAVTLRIVYDGLGTAGKTTNIQQLHALFTLARAGDVIVPEERRGRTLYFDWLELETGFLDDLRLRCQVLTVPGQFAYVQRRWQLLKTPDAIVQVCDSSPEGLPRTRYALRFLHAMLDAGHCAGVPIIYQANKQDLPGALPPEELAVALGLPPSARVIGAAAPEGLGIRETFIFALQAARERAREALLTRGLDALERRSESAADVFQQMLSVEAADAEQQEAALLADAVLSGEGWTPPPGSVG
jgi:signal recognition particle receptor subunit beta